MVLPLLAMSLHLHWVFTSRYTSKYMESSPDFKRYLFRYNHNGAEWNFKVLATSPEDARARVARMVFAKYDGEVVASIPVPAFPIRPLQSLRALGRRWFGVGT